ncbi:MAG: glycosyltransferase family 39 protein [Candidatus Andersenbacteria bacterium]
MTIASYWQTVRQHRLFWIVATLLVVKCMYIGVTLLFVGQFLSSTIFSAAPFLNLWSRWDTSNYISIALNNYQPGTADAKLIAFLPLYPTLIRIGSLVFSPQAAAIIIANIASLVGLVLFYELGRREYGVTVAWRALLAILLFPTAYFFFAPYTESLFLLLSVAAWLFARRGQWFWAGSLGGLAAVTRITGVLLFPALIVEWWLQHRQHQRTVWSGLWLLLIPLYFGLYLGINYELYGTPLAFITAASEWSKEFAWPWDSLWSRFKAIGLDEYGLMLGVSEFVAGIMLVIGVVWSWLRLRPSYAAYLTLTAFVLLSTSYLQSTPRYLLTLFPLFYIVGMYPTAKWLAIPSVGLLTFFTLRWLVGAWAF